MSDTPNSRKGLELVTLSPVTVVWHCTVPPVTLRAGSYEEPYETGTRGKMCKIICKPDANLIILPVPQRECGSEAT